MKEGNLRKATLTKEEGSQSGGVQIFFKFGGSQSGRVLFSQNRRDPNPEGSYIYYFIGVPIRRGLHFANPEGSCSCQSGGVLFY